MFWYKSLARNQPGDLRLEQLSRDFQKRPAPSDLLSGDENFQNLNPALGPEFTINERVKGAASTLAKVRLQGDVLELSVIGAIPANTAEVQINIRTRKLLKVSKQIKVPYK